MTDDDDDLRVAEGTVELANAAGHIGFVIEAARDLAVADEEDAQMAAELLGQLNAASKAIEAKRVALTKPLNDVVRVLNEAAKQTQGELPAVIAALRERISAYRTAQDQARTEAEAKAQADSGQRHVDPGSLPARAEQRQTTSTGTVGGRKRWTFEITDERAFLVACTKSKKAWEEHGDMAMPSLTYVNAAIKDGLRDFPGIKIFEKTDVVVR